ncbi:MAG: M17 family peptidase N-terminal domain-containing protein, partial [Gemmatimonadota bacterium]
MVEAKVRVTGARAVEARTPLLALPRFEDGGAPTGSAAAEVDVALGGAIGRLLERGDFTGAEGQTAVLYPEPDAELGAERVVLVGAGERDGYDAEALRRVVGWAVREAERLRVALLAFALDVAGLPGRGMMPEPEAAAEAAAEAAVLASWRFDELKNPAEDEPAPAQVDAFHLLTADEVAAGRIDAAAARGAVAASAENLARALAMRPGNVATPMHLAETAETIAREHGLEATVLDRAAIEAEGMGALLAVAQGSAQEPRFIVLEHPGAGDDSPPVALVGKGVTFDTGGISLKPS